MTDARQTITASMQPIIDAIGFDDAIALVSACGGLRVNVTDGAAGPVIRAIGPHANARLVAAIGCGAVDVPRCLSWLLARRNEEIVARHLAGETQAELALRFRLTERHIRNIVRLDADEQPETPQHDLFARNTESPAP